MTTRLCVLIPALVLATVTLAAAQTTEPVEVRCPSVLGVGIATDVPFCDVEVQRDPDLGILVVLPPHSGEATLSFDLHNRHIYSEDDERSGRAYAQYVATVAVATMEGVIIARGVVLSEFRSAADLVDRVRGGAGPRGVKAIAPTGSERLMVTIPAGIDQVSIVGQTLKVARIDSRDTVQSIGRTVAVLSGATVMYRPR